MATRTPPQAAFAMQYSIRTDSRPVKAPASSPSSGPTPRPGNNARSPIRRLPKPVAPRPLPIWTSAVAKLRDSRIFILRVYAHITWAYKVVRPDILRLPGVPKDGDVSGFPAPCGECNARTGGHGLGQLARCSAGGRCAPQAFAREISQRDRATPFDRRNQHPRFS